MMFTRSTILRSTLQIGARNFSAPVKHFPPKKIHGITGRYAESLYVAASKVGSLETVENELKAFSAILKSSPNFAAFLMNPTIPRGEKTAKVADILGSDEKISYITKNLFVTMTANGRIGEVNKVISSYFELMEASRGIVKAVLTTAEPLKPKVIESIKVAVAAIAGAGKKVDLEIKEDTSILGGLQILVGDKFLDLSVASRISTLSKELESSHL